MSRSKRGSFLLPAIVCSGRAHPVLLSLAANGKVLFLQLAVESCSGDDALSQNQLFLVLLCRYT